MIYIFFAGYSHSYYFLRLTPIFWQEVVSLYNSIGKNKDDFSRKIEEKIHNIFKDYFNKNKDSITIKNIGRWIHDNWSDINNKWKNSDKTKRIEIRFTIKRETESPTSQQILIASWHEPVELNTWLVANFLSFNIVPDIDDFYWINESIIEEILETIDYFGTNSIDSIDLGIIDNEDDKTILNALQNKYPNLKISELDVIEKSLVV